MNNIRKNSYIVFAIIILIAIIFVINNLLSQKVQKLKHNKYTIQSSKIKEQISTSIENKSISTLNIAIALSENSDFKKFLQNDSELDINLKKVSKKIKEHSIYKNVWIQLVDKNGISKYRSWTNKKGDDVSKKRSELPILLKNPTVTRLVSVGIFDITFKAIVPLYSNKEFLGLIEVITKMNSIAIDLKKIGLESVILVDERFKKQIKKPFTNMFINDFYVANLNAKKELQKIIEKDVSSYLNIDKYKIENKNFIITYKLKNILNEDIAYYVVFKDLDSIDLSDIDDFESFIQIVATLILCFILSVFIALYFYNKTKYTKQLENSVTKRTKELKELTKRYQQIFEEAKTIKIIVDPNNLKIVDANEAALKFYGYEKENFKNLSFKNLTIDQIEYEKFKDIIDEKQNVINYKHILSNKEIKDVEIYTSKININKKVYIYLIIRDITQELKMQTELKRKEQLFYQQSKMAAMGEMLQNIAHQWRQPLSVISTAASGTKLKKEFGDLDDKFFFESIDLIIKTSAFLSNTIDDFRDFFIQSKETQEFKLLDAINSTIKLSNMNIKDINLEIDCIDISIKAYRNELIQVFLNIVNNSKYVLNENKPKDKIIKVVAKKHKNDFVKISVLDNGGGIDENNINKVFEPYFTTKHQSQGTGIGLYMSEQIITKHFNGILKVQNQNFNYKNKNYFGANFEIIIPIKLDS